MTIALNKNLAMQYRDFFQLQKLKSSLKKMA